MVDKEILEKVYERLRDRHHSPEQKMFWSVDFIEQEWQRRDETEAKLDEIEMKERGGKNENKD